VNLTANENIDININFVLVTVPTLMVPTKSCDFVQH